MNTIKPKDIIAAITIIGIMVLKFKGLDGGLDTAGALILGYYFAHRRNGDDKGV